MWRLKNKIHSKWQNSVDVNGNIHSSKATQEVFWYMAIDQWVYQNRININQLECAVKHSEDMENGVHVETCLNGNRFQLTPTQSNRHKFSVEIVSFGNFIEYLQFHGIIWTIVQENSFMRMYAKHTHTAEVGRNQTKEKNFGTQKKLNYHC